MSTTTAETPTERKPPTIADIVREKTGDGALIIDFFTDVMTGRIEGAELCHRIDAAKQLVKYGSKDAAEFIAKYKGVPCGHSTRGRPNQADPCSAPERTLVEVTLNAPPTLTREFLTVLSGIDEFLMARLIRAQTADGDTIIEFLDDVMHDRADGFKTRHRIAAAKELIVHIIRDEQPSHTPSPSTGEGWGEGDSILVPEKSGTQGGGGARNTPANPAHPEPVLSTAEGPSSTVIPAKAGIQRGGGGRNTVANSPRTEPVEGSVRAEPVLSTAEGSAHPELVEGSEPAEGSQLETPPARRPRTRRTRTQRRRDGNARAAIRRKALGSEPIEDEIPAPVELTPAERRINEKLKQHWHEPDPWAGPIDSTTPARSPPS